MEMVFPFQHNPRVTHNESSYLFFNKSVHPLKHSLTGKFIGQVRVNLWRQCVNLFQSTSWYTLWQQLLFQILHITAQVATKSTNKPINK